MSVLVLLSGGIDSATVLAMFRGEKREALGFRYGQPHAIELERAAEIAKHEDVPFSIIDLPIIPKIDDVIFAVRNAVFVSLGASVALAHGHEAVAVGCNYSDWERFPDCRPDFINPLAKAIHYGYGIKLIAPVLRMSKWEIVEEGKRLGVPLERAWSCYGPGPEPCGKCLACETRTKAGT